MSTNRRTFLQGAAALLAAPTVAKMAQAQSGSPAGKTSPSGAPVPYKRIATEEAWAPKDLIATYRRMAAQKTIDDPGFSSDIQADE